MPFRPRLQKIKAITKAIRTKATAIVTPTIKLTFGDFEGDSELSGGAAVEEETEPGDESEGDLRETRKFQEKAKNYFG